MSWYCSVGQIMVLADPEHVVYTYACRQFVVHIQLCRVPWVLLNSKPEYYLRRGLEVVVRSGLVITPFQPGRGVLGEWEHDAAKMEAHW